MPNLSKVGWGFTGNQIEEKVRQGLEEFRIPLSKKNPDEHYITFENINFKRDPKAESTAAIKEAVVFEKSILAAIKADVVEYTGRRKKVLLRQHSIGQIPQLIESRKTFMVTGSEYNLINQPRRKSSAYVYSGQGTAIADFNLAKGRNFSIEVDTTSGYAVVEIGGSKVALRVVLESLGIERHELLRVTDAEFARDHWDTLNHTSILNNYRKLYSRLFEFKQEDVRSLTLDVMKDACTEYFKQTAVDPKTTEYLFHKPHQRVDKAFMLDVLDKFHKVNIGEDEGIDPDDLYYQKLYPPSMLFLDRIRKVEKEVSNAVRQKMKLGHEPDKIFRNVFSKYFVSMINSSDLSRLDPQYNPIGIATSSAKTSPIGMGGIGDIKAVTRSKRGVHSSYLGVVDPTASAQGQNVGVQLMLTDDVMIDEEGEIYLPLKNKSGKVENMQLADTYNKRILLPGQQNQKEKHAMYQGKLEKVKGNNYDYELPRDTNSLLSEANQLVPFSQAVQGNRSFMTVRQITQAVPLKYGEAPLVAPVNEKGESTYRALRKNLESLLPMESPYNGTVTKLKEGEIHITDDKGVKQVFNYHEHLPFATNTGVHQTPIVAVGDKVKKGDMLVKDAYTTDKGEFALGKNLRFAFAPYYGDNTEDGIVISESAAEKLTSMHYYTYNTKITDTFILDKTQFRRVFGVKYGMDINWDDYDDKGIIKKGTVVEPGKPVILIIEKRTPDDKLKNIARISGNLIVDTIDGSKLYESRVAGTVVDVSSSPKFASVTVETEERAQQGDKMTGMYGNKGTVSRVTPDDQMLQDEKGNPLDIVYSSTTVVSRINPGQIVENALGKIVKDKGLEPYKVPVNKNPTKDDLVTFAEKELKKHGVKEKEKLYNPVSGKHIERPIAVGEMYMLKLLKGDKDVSARAVGPGYSGDDIPTKGGKQGAKAIGTAEFHALTAHNARAFLTDAGNIKSQKNERYWKAMEMGITDPVIPESKAWQKTKSLITAAGGYITQDNTGLQVAPLTDRLTDQLAGHRKIDTPALLSSKDLEPLKKGLFDPKVTGGTEGTMWSKIQLEDGIVSPLVVDYLRIILGKSKEEMKKWQAEHSTKEMKDELNKIDTAGRLRELKTKSQTKDLNNSEIKELRFLKNLKDQNMKLADLIVTKLPVPPPIYRPISKMDDGGVQISDVNLFYKDVMLANEAVKDTKGTMFKSEAKATLVDNVNALIGTEETQNVQLKKKGTRGILKYIAGVSSPKEGYVHNNLMKKNQDLAGRARIIADSQMSMDDIGIPEKMAWKLFEPHTMKELRNMGIPPIEAAKKIKDQDDLSRKALDKAMEKTNVLGNRAPTLHRFGMLSFNPKIVPGSSIHLNLPATGPFNADFDGDAIQIHVPSSEKVSRSLENLKLSKLPFSDVAPGSLVTKLHTEAILGLYQMSVNKPAKFKSDIKGIVGAGYDIPVPSSKKAVHALIAKVAEKEPDKYAEVFDNLRKLGETYATDIGSTVGLEDIKPMVKERDALVRKAEKQLEKAKTPVERAKILSRTQKEAMEIAKSHKGDLTMLVKSGAKGSDMQLANILLSPILSYDPDRPIETATLTPTSYAEGLSPKDSWKQGEKIRKDAVGTALNVAVPGSIGKLITYNTLKEVISMADCGTSVGLEMGHNDKSVVGRVLAESYPGFKKGDVITFDNMNKLPKRKVLVRSPEKCAAQEGICQKCYGTDTHWRFLDIGTHVGIRAAHAAIEPLAQRALDSKHGGRDITKDVGKGGLQDLTNLFSSDPSKAEVATLSVRDDRVAEIKIRKGATHLIKMESGQLYRIHPASEIIVKEGDKVKKGDLLTKGITPYTEMVKIKGIDAGRQSLTQSFKNLLGDGSPVHSRLLETIAKGAVNHIVVQSAFDSYIPGDTITYNKFLDMAKTKGITIPVSEVSPGMCLAEEAQGLSAGHPLTQDDIDDYLSKIPSGKVKVFPKHIRVKPAVKSFYTSGQLEDDFIQNLSQKYIKKTIEKAATEGAKSPRKSLSPVHGWMTGRPINTDGPHF